MFKVCLLSAVMTAGLFTGATLAQDDPAQTQPAFEAPAPYSPSWTDKSIAKIAGQLSGTWKATDQVDGATIWMTVAPAPVEGMSDTLYVESVRADTPWEPYRRAMYQLYRYKDGIRLRTYEFALDDTSKGVLNGMWAATEYFPDISADDLIATLDVELETTPTGFSGATPYPYPTGVGGAVEMTSSVSLDGDTLSVADRGFAADGSIAWGAEKDSAISFTRAEPYAKVTRRDDGMVIIDYGPMGGITPQDGDELHVHYNGYLANGTRFDSSYARNLPFVFTYPPGNRAIAGWGIGMDQFAADSHRKLIIPAYLAYKERGNPRANIPGDSTLYFNAWMAHIEHHEPQPDADQGGAQAPDATQGAQGSQDQEGHEGHDHD